MAGEAQDARNTFETPDGVALYERLWDLGEAAEAALIIVHGLGEHCARYDSLAARLNAEGYSVFSYDQRGHGRSPGRRGAVWSFDALLRDLDFFTERIVARVAGKPLFMLGHSLGGLILAHHALAHPPGVRGYVFSSSAFKISDDAPPVLLKMSGVLSLFLPWFPMIQLDAKGLSRDPEEVKRYEEDPLVYHGKITARTSGEMMRAIRSLQERAGELTQPFIALHGTLDALAECEGSVLLHEKAASKDKTLKLYEGAYHEVFNDLDKEQFIQDMLAWLNARR